jgi:transposase
MSNSRTKRKFTQEFKTEAARLVTNQGYTCAAAAEAVGINVSLMAKWVRAYREASGDIATAFPGKGHLSPHDAELAEIRKQLKKVTNERDILKKAMAYFASLPE